jgi:hypothetical protein
MVRRPFLTGAPRPRAAEGPRVSFAGPVRDPVLLPVIAHTCVLLRAPSVSLQRNRAAPDRVRARTRATCRPRGRTKRWARRHSRSATSAHANSTLTPVHPPLRLRRDWSACLTRRSSDRRWDGKPENRISVYRGATRRNAASNASGAMSPRWSDLAYADSS